MFFYKFKKKCVDYDFHETTELSTSTDRQTD